MGVGPQRLIRALGTEVGTPQWEPYGVTGFFIIAGLIPPDSLPRPVLGLELPGEGYPSWLVFGQQPALSCSDLPTPARPASACFFGPITPLLLAFAAPPAREGRISLGFGVEDLGSSFCGTHEFGV